MNHYYTITYVFINYSQQKHNSHICKLCSFYVGHSPDSGIMYTTPSKYNHSQWQYIYIFNIAPPMRWHLKVEQGFQPPFPTLENDRYRLTTHQRQLVAIGRALQPLTEKSKMDSLLLGSRSRHTMYNTQFIVSPQRHFRIGQNSKK